MLDDDSDEASSASGVSAPTVGSGNPNYASPNKAKKRKKKSKGSSSSSGVGLDKTYRYEHQYFHSNTGFHTCTAYVHRFNVEISDESYQVSWLDLVAEEEEKNEAKAKKDFKGSKAMMGGSIDPYASDDDDQLKVSFDKLLFLVHLIYMS